MTETIRVIINSDKTFYYSGFGGSFATFSDSCMRKRSLPGIYGKDLIKNALVEGCILILSLKGGLSDEEITELMDVALKNTGTFPASEETPGFDVIIRRD